MTGRPEVVAVLERVNRSLARVQKVEDLRRIEAATTKKLAAQFRNQGRRFVAELGKFKGQFEEAVGEGSWNRAWDVAASDTAGAMEVAIFDAADKSWKKGAERVVADFGLASSFTLANPRAVEYLRNHAADMVAKVDETTRGYIRTLMVKAVDEGWSYDRTAKILIERFEEFAVGSPLRHIESRAHLIAVTESAYAYEAAGAQVVTQMSERGVPIVKSWITVGDDRVDPDCDGNESEGWIARDANFSSGDSEPPAHPGCRCTAGYQVSEDWLGPMPGGPGT